VLGVSGRRAAMAADVDAADAPGPPDPLDGPPASVQPPPVARDPSTRRALPALPAAALALASGALLVPAFPPMALWWLAPIAVALLAVALRGQRARRGAWLGLLHGLVFFTWLLHWTGIYVGPVPWLALAFAESCYVAGFGALLAATSSVTDRWRWTWPLLVGAGWVSQEALRGRWPFGGFPWGRIAFAEANGPLVHLATLGGAPLVTFAVGVLGALLVLMATSRRRALVAWVAAAAAVFMVALLVPLISPIVTPPGSGEAPRRVNVAVIQGNVPRLGLDFNAQRRAVLDNHVQATLALATRVKAGTATRPDIVIWPENSSDIDPLENADAGAEIDAAAAAINAPILVGAVLLGPGDDRTNAGLVWAPGRGVVDKYAKRHPVPFGEYIPLRSLVRKVSSQVDLVAHDFAPGHRVGLVTMPLTGGGDVPVGDVICFEVAYDGLVDDTVQAGAQILAVQTNNATFGLTGESSQQVAMAQLRAVEHDRWAIVASTSGISAVINPDGRVVQHAGLFSKATLLQSVTLNRTRTPAARLGRMPEYLFCVVSAAGLVVALALSRRRTTTAGLPPTEAKPTTETESSRLVEED
jgi:apolipoprotein N-acyltransferase